MNDNEINYLCKMLQQSHDMACKASGFTETILMQALEAIVYLREQRDEALQKVQAMRDGFEGCCPCCEPVGVRNQELQKKLSQYTMDKIAELDKEMGL